MNVPGEPGTDYPAYTTLPQTGFSCEGRSRGKSLYVKPYRLPRKSSIALIIIPVCRFVTFSIIDVKDGYIHTRTFVYNVRRTLTTILLKYFLCFRNRSSCLKRNYKLSINDVERNERKFL